MLFPAVVLDPPIGPARTFLYDMPWIPIVDRDAVQFDRSDPEHPRIALNTTDQVDRTDNSDQGIEEVTGG